MIGRGVGVALLWLAVSGPRAFGAVELRAVDAGTLAEARRNPTVGLRLISVWATWCAPCVVELPDLVALDREYRGPRFDTVTVSADEAARHETALRVLERAKATFTNYRFRGDLSELIATLDPSWTGALPFTMLVAPGGEVLFRGEGTLEIDGLRRAIERWRAAPARVDTTTERRRR